MFLIATADERFWKTDESVLLLGEWCRTYANRHRWLQIPHAVVRYHWDDRLKLDRDYEYIDTLYERTLDRLSRSLGRIHSVDRSNRYWRIIIGPWLSQFITIAFDRYECLVRAAAAGATSTLIPADPVQDWVPRDMREFLGWYADDDAYNQFLIGRLIEKTAVVPCEAAGTPARRASVRRRRRATLRDRVQRLTWRLALAAPARLTRIVLVESSLSAADEVRLQLAMGQMPTLRAREIDIPPASYDESRRRSLDGADPANAFEAALLDLVREQIPSVYVEHYAAVRERALASYPRAPRVMFTAVAYEAHEAFKIWAAEQVHSGARLVGTQHGCHFGTARRLETEAHQLRIYDRFFTWGWSASGHSHVVPLPAAKFNRAARRVRPIPTGDLLFALCAWPRYAYRLYSVPIAASGMLAYMEEQFRFAEALPGDIRAALLVRGFPNDRGWQQNARWTDRLPGVRCDPGGVRFLDRLSQARLLVCTGTSTTHLEGFAADFPTMLFWNPAMMEIRPSAQPLYDGLAAAGILHASPEAAAMKVRDIWNDPLTWWRTPKVQRAKDAYCEHFARGSRHWLREWKAALTGLANAPAVVEPVTRLGMAETAPLVSKPTE